ncbi:hypothetical protein ACVIHH_000660 [Bradyrhizobium sp. USDA 4518]
MRGICEPHIGEYATKTNAVRDRQHTKPVAGTHAEHGLCGDPWGPNRPYWPWVFSTWSQAELILLRFCCRQARMVKSP